MANIPPLLSSSPPPLDITDDNEDFIDEIPDDEYTFDVISDPNFNPNVMSEDKFHHNNDSCQIMGNDVNTTHNIDLNKTCVEIASSEVEIIDEDHVEIKSNGCENNNDKIDSSVITSSNIEAAVKQEADTLEIKEDTMNYLCHAPVKEVTELIDTPPPLSNHEIVCSADGIEETTCLSEETCLGLTPTYMEPEFMKDNLTYELTNDVDLNIHESSVSNPNDKPAEVLEHEYVKETSNVCNDLEVKLDEIPFPVNGVENECPDNFDDFDDFVCAPEPVPKIATCDLKKVEHESLEEVETKCEDSPIISEQGDVCTKNSNEEENDFDDFVFQEYASPETNTNNIESEVKEEHIVIQSEEQKKQILDTESIVTNESLNSISNNDEATIHKNQENADSDFDEDFGDFSSFEIHNPAKVQTDNTPSVLNLFNETMCLNKNNDEDALFTKLQSVVLMMFPEEQSEENVSEYDNTKKESMCVLKDLTDLEITNATTFQWRNSKSHNVTLKALGIDSRNIMYGPRWNNGMPRFASNLSCGPLEPLKPIPVTNNSTNLAPQKTFHPSPKETSDANDVPTAEFDWAGAGLVNPLDAKNIQANLLDLSSLGHIISPQQSQISSINPLTELNFLHCRPVKTQAAMKENPPIMPIIEKTIEKYDKQIEQSDKNITVQGTDFETSFGNSNNIQKNNLDDTSFTVNPIATHSFNLPETHIYTSPTAVSQTISENVQQEKSIVLESNTMERYNLPDNIFNTDISTESFTNISDTKDAFDSNELHQNKILEGISQMNVSKPSPIENVSMNGNIMPFDSINADTARKNDTFGIEPIAYNSYSKDSTQHIPITLSNSNTLNDNGKTNSDSLTYLNSVPKPDLLSPAVIDSDATGNSHDRLDDFDTSFNDFQSYENNQRTTTFTQPNHVFPNIHSTQSKYLPPVPILTPTILQPVVANSFKPSIDWSSSDTVSKHCANSIQSNAPVEDPQTEWSDFVSISTVAKDFNSSSTLTNSKHNLDINAFKVPIQIDPLPVKNLPPPPKETDVDDWTDFVSSAPVVHNLNNGFKRMEPSDKWNRTTPQFSNWQTNTYHMPHVMPNYSRAHNSNVNGFAYNQQNVLNDFKTSLKFHKSDTNNVQYKQAERNKQKNLSGQSSVHSEIPSISSVPELGFVVPQSLLYLSNLPKK